MGKTGSAEYIIFIESQQMANFGEDVFDIHVPGDFVFPEPYYED